jgi:hypothetical protein
MIVRGRRLLLPLILRKRCWHSICQMPYYSPMHMRLLEFRKLCLLCSLTCSTTICADRLCSIASISATLRPHSTVHSTTSYATGTSVSISSSSTTDHVSNISGSSPICATGYSSTYSRLPQHRRHTWQEKSHFCTPWSQSQAACTPWCIICHLQSNEPVPVNLTTQD